MLERGRQLLDSHKTLKNLMQNKHNTQLMKQIDKNYFYHSLAPS